MTITIIFLKFLFPPELNNSLTFPDGVKFYPDIKDGIRGFNTDPARGADTFVPFITNKRLISLIESQYGDGIITYIDNEYIVASLDSNANISILKDIKSTTIHHVMYSVKGAPTQTFNMTLNDTSMHSVSLGAGQCYDFIQKIDLHKGDIIKFNLKTASPYHTQYFSLRK